MLVGLQALVLLSTTVSFVSMQMKTGSAGQQDSMTAHAV
jgi:hypothetical protein